MEINKNELLKLIEEEEQGAISSNYAKSEPIKYSKEYSEFKKELSEQNIKKTWYEKYVGLFDSITLNLSKKDEEKILKKIKFSGLNVKPSSIILAAITTLIAGVFGWIIFEIVALLLKATLNITNIPALIIYSPLIAGMFGAYFIYAYPGFKSSVNRIKYGEDIIMALLYIIVYLKTSGNLEGAVRYAASNIKGKISQDFNTLLWEVETGKYYSIYDALSDYAKQWNDYMKEFTQALYLIKEAIVEVDEERKSLLLEKALDLLLSSFDEKMKNYARALELPIQVIHAIGIMLPVLGMVVLPLITILMSDKLTNLTFYLFSFYDIILPIVLLFFINATLQKRPATLGRVNVSNHPSLPRKGYFFLKINNKVYELNVKTTTLIIAGIMLLVSLAIYIPSYLKDPNTGAVLWGATGILISLSTAIALYHYLKSEDRIKIRNKIAEIEKEFEEALFVLGNALSGNLPLEKALERTIKDIEGLSIADMFKKILYNMTQLSMTFKNAIFDKKYGVIKEYPSDLIKNILRILAEIIEKGTQAAALSMITISRYLRNIKTTQEKIDDLLSSTLSAMKFNAYVLIPVIGGVIVAVSKLILVLLLQMGGIYDQIAGSMNTQGVQGMDTNIDTGFAFDVDNAIPTSTTFLIIGIYIIEMLYILAIFIARTKNGMDEILESKEIYNLVIIGTIVFLVSYGVINMMFSGVIEGITQDLLATTQQ